MNAARRLRIATCRPLPEVDPDEDLLLDALRGAGIAAEMVAWQHPDAWRAPIPTLVRSTWDYIHALEDFDAWIDRAGTRPRCCAGACASGISSSSRRAACR